MIIRWLGAFGKSNSLHESLQFEINRTATDEVAGEKIKKGMASQIGHARVGLLVKNSAQIKFHKGDVYSFMENGKLKKQRNYRNAYGTHTECWVNAEYIGIVIKNKIQDSAFKTILYIADLNNLPVYKFTKGGGLKKIY